MDHSFDCIIGKNEHREERNIGRYMYGNSNNTNEMPKKVGFDFINIVGNNNQHVFHTNTNTKS